MWNSKVSADDARVLLLGWSYKAEVGDPRETPAGPLAESLISMGINVKVFDPYLEVTQFPENIQAISSIDEADGFDIVVLVTAHYDCVNLDWKKLINRMRKPMVYDGRRVLDIEKLEEIGWTVHAVGRPVSNSQA